MEHKFTKLTEVNDEYTIICQGGSDESKFGRVFNASLRGTHQLDFREQVIQDGEVKRKGIVVWMRPLDLSEIRVRSDDFTTLSAFELKELVERYKIKLKPQEGRPDATADKVAMIEALREFKPEKPAAPAAKPAQVIPREVDELDLNGALTKAATLGVSTKAVGNKQADLPTLKKRIAAKLAEQEKEAGIDILIKKFKH